MTLSICSLRYGAENKFMNHHIKLSIVQEIRNFVSMASWESFELCRDLSAKPVENGSLKYCHMFFLK